MTTPLCHRTFNVPPDHETPRVHDCIGSKCALWVPAYLYQHEWHRAAGASKYGAVSASRQPSKAGWCADNPNREPWPDPSAGEGGG